MIKQVDKRYILCQRKRAKNIQSKMSDLPFARLEHMKPPFSSTRIDLFRPVMIKQWRARLKHWGALFSCFSTWAIRLEVVEGYGTNSLIGSFQRFINRRGKPRDVYSNCGTNLKGTASELNIKLHQINKYSSNKQITWHFNPPAASWMEGIWERSCSAWSKTQTFNWWQYSQRSKQLSTIKLLPTLVTTQMTLNCSH